MLSSNQVRRAREGRYALLTGLVMLGFGLVIAGLLRLQVFQHDQYVELSKENRVRLEVLRAVIDVNVLIWGLLRPRSSSQVPCSRIPAESP